MSRASVLIELSQHCAASSSSPSSASRVLSLESSMASDASRSTSICPGPELPSSIESIRPRAVGVVGEAPGGHCLQLARGPQHGRQRHADASTTSPTIQPATSADTRIARSRTPSATTPAVATTLMSTDSALNRLRSRAGSSCCAVNLRVQADPTSSFCYPGLRGTTVSCGPCPLLLLRLRARSPAAARARRQERPPSALWTARVRRSAPRRARWPRS